MLLWIIFAVLTAVALTAVLWPFLKARRDVDIDDNHATAIYRDQLGEIDADLARDLVNTSEAEAAKTEISRRILAAAASSDGRRVAMAGGAPGSNPSKMAAVLTLLGLPALSVTLYLMHGSPSMPDQPFVARQSAPEVSQDIATLIKQVEERLRAHPEDGQGWDVIAPVYLRQRRYDDAADAFRRALRLRGDNTGRLVGYAESLVLANNGIVSEEARRAFEKAHGRDRSLAKPRFWLGMSREQDGQFGAAAEIWRGMLADASADAPWRAMVEQRLKLAESKLADSGAPPAADRPAVAAEPGPSREDVAAAGQMTTQERSAMINQMVEGLAQRLQKDGNDLKGWLRLVRAYSVLGKQDKAAEALKTARESFKDDEKALAELSALAGNIGL